MPAEIMSQRFRNVCSTDEITRQNKGYFNFSSINFCLGHRRGQHRANFAAGEGRPQGIVVHAE
jgi:hypothetical protein